MIGTPSIDKKLWSLRDEKLNRDRILLYKVSLIEEERVQRRDNTKTGYKIAKRRGTRKSTGRQASRGTVSILKELPIDRVEHVEVRC